MPRLKQRAGFGLDSAACAAGDPDTLAGRTPGSPCAARFAPMRLDSASGRLLAPLLLDSASSPAPRLAPGAGLEPAVERVETRFEGLVAALPQAGLALVIVLGAWLLARAVARWDRPYRRLQGNRFVSDLVRGIARALVLLAGVAVALEILDASHLVGALAGTAGVAGLALGFAFRDLIENYVASILLSLRQPFAPNDHVPIDGFEGRVARLTSRATILITPDGNNLRIPNATVFKGIILNYTRNPERRFGYPVAIHPSASIARCRRCCWTRSPAPKESWPSRGRRCKSRSWARPRCGCGSSGGWTSAASISPPCRARRCGAARRPWRRRRSRRPSRSTGCARRRSRLRRCRRGPRPRRGTEDAGVARDISPDPELARKSAQEGAPTRFPTCSTRRRRANERAAKLQGDGRGRSRQPKPLIY